MLTKETWHEWRWLLGGYGNIYFVISDWIIKKIDIIIIMAGGSGNLIIFLAGVIVLVITSILYNISDFNDNGIIHDAIIFFMVLSGLTILTYAAQFLFATKFKETNVDNMSMKRYTQYNKQGPFPISSIY